MKILIRLPNWLGDMVMSTAFVEAVNQCYPNAEIGLIAKKGIHPLLDFFPKHAHRYLFSKQEYKGLWGAWAFGKSIAKSEKYDVYFSLPDSFSTALMGLASGAKHRVGYKNSIRTLLLTHAYNKKKNGYHVEAFLELLSKYAQKPIPETKVILKTTPTPVRDHQIILNINSEAASRKWPLSKAISRITALRKALTEELILVGSPAEKAFVDQVYEALPDKKGITNLAGSSPLPLLIEIMGKSKLIISSESGPAQIGNAVGTPTLVTFGASNEKIGMPYPNTSIIGIRYGQLSCEPCLKNTCKLYKEPECQMRLDDQVLVNKALEILNKV